jgi:hypothetical protein
MGSAERSAQTDRSVLKTSTERRSPQEENDAVAVREGETRDGRWGRRWQCGARLRRRATPHGPPGTDWT